MKVCAEITFTGFIMLCRKVVTDQAFKVFGPTLITAMACMNRVVPKMYNLDATVSVNNLPKGLANTRIWADWRYGNHKICVLAA